MRAIIIEDETAAAVNLKAMLAKCCADIEILATLESIAESIEWLSHNDMPEVIFSDIHLADGEAFKIYERVKVTAPIIFTTAYDQYALEAFKTSGIDYILKPIVEEELQRAIDKLKLFSSSERQQYSQKVEAMAVQQIEQQVFLVQSKDRIIPLKADDIAFCYTFEERVTAYSHNGTKYPLDKTLEALSNLLPAKDFFRANRHFIVSRTAVKDISVWFGSLLALHLILPTPARIIISKARVSEFKRWLTT